MSPAPCAITLLAAVLVTAAGPTPLQKEAPIFDGRSFDGWDGDTKTIWRIEDGALAAGSLTVTVPRNDFLVTTREYANFVLRLKFKLVGTEGFVNGGVQFRSQRTQQPAHEMTGYQADLGDGFWGSLYDESRRNKTLVNADPAIVKEVLKRGDWNDYEIRAEGPRIRLRLNGRETVDYTEPDPAIPQRGLIGLQVHGGGKAIVYYKDIRIEELR